MATKYPLSSRSLLDHIDATRRELSRELDPEVRAELGQFFTPSDVGVLMASMLDLSGTEVRLLDP